MADHKPAVSWIPVDSGGMPAVGYNVLQRYGGVPTDSGLFSLTRGHDCSIGQTNAWR
jgi:hypothetical protein